MRHQDIAPEESSRGANARFGADLVRAFVGTLLFAFPMMMTMEMWWLGFAIHRLRLVLFLLLGLLLLVGLTFYGGFEDPFTGRDDLLDVFVSYAVGFAAVGLILLLLAVVGPGMSTGEVLGKLAVQAMPGAIGAMFARKLLGGNESEQGHRKRKERYGGQLFMMAIGAVFLSMSLASTEEMLLIAYQKSEWHALGLAGTSVLLMHVLMFWVRVPGQPSPRPPNVPGWSLFLRFTVVGYIVALIVGGYVLWTFGRMDGLAVQQRLLAMIVLGFPASLGAAASRLVL